MFFILGANLTLNLQFYEFEKKITCELIDFDCFFEYQFYIFYYIPSFIFAGLHEYKYPTGK